MSHYLFIKITSIGIISIEMTSIEIVMSKSEHIGTVTIIPIITVKIY